MSIEDYDPKLHATAGELRAMFGIEFSPEIPDCAYTRRSEIKFETVMDESPELMNARQFKATIQMRMGSFHWLIINIKVENADLEEKK